MKRKNVIIFIHSEVQFKYFINVPFFYLKRDESITVNFFASKVSLNQRFFFSSDHIGRDLIFSVYTSVRICHLYMYCSCLEFIILSNWWIITEFIFSDNSVIVHGLSLAGVYQFYILSSLSVTKVIFSIKKNKPTPNF